MDAFVSRKRKRIEPEPEPKPATGATRILEHEPGTQHEEEPTEFKLALLASLHPNLDEATLLETLLAADGSVEQASDYLNQPRTTSPRKRSTPATVGYQSSLSSYRITPLDGNPAKKSSAVKKGRTLSLYSPEDIEAHTPCSIIHNFLPPKQADALLSQLLEETPTYKTLEFKLFDRVVVTRSTFAFYVNSLEEAEEQKTEYVYDGRKIEAS
ncbi:hypothetical protein A1F97_11046 [Pyrenophora tritici-repentis]|uniref:CUE domain-containing protein n=1 Tax=Pyrenophora tritici-repentis TaxID=45151 RepID=A0A2W1CXH6_9PLEO|nr:hypothetical protein PtrM4_029350 [Pyrenophora tritici-repentis]PZD25323.1 hypothetical protein A1F97_11046 [Pyrenophora tritici-repentis]